MIPLTTVYSAESSKMSQAMNSAIAQKSADKLTGAVAVQKVNQKIMERIASVYLDEFQSCYPGVQVKVRSQLQDGQPTFFVKVQDSDSKRMSSLDMQDAIELFRRGKLRGPLSFLH